MAAVAPLAGPAGKALTERQVVLLVVVRHWVPWVVHALLLLEPGLDLLRVEVGVGLPLPPQDVHPEDGVVNLADDSCFSPLGSDLLVLVVGGGDEDVDGLVRLEEGRLDSSASRCTGRDTEPCSVDLSSELPVAPAVASCETLPMDHCLHYPPPALRRCARRHPLLAREGSWGRTRTWRRRGTSWSPCCRPCCART